MKGLHYLIKHCTTSQMATSYNLFKFNIFVKQQEGYSIRTMHASNKSKNYMKSAKYQHVNKSPNGNTSMIQISTTKADLSPAQKHVRVWLEAHWTLRSWCKFEQQWKLEAKIQSKWRDQKFKKRKLSTYLQSLERIF